MNDQEIWHEGPQGDVHALVWRHVLQIEQEQGGTFDRLALLESLYDQYSPTGDDTSSSTAKLLNVTENVVATNVDTTYASVATAEVRARFLTDGADWGMQRRAKKMEYYTEGLGKLHHVHKKCRLAFKEAEKKGGGLVKAYANRWKELAVEHVKLEDIYVPDEDSRSGMPPMQLHHVQRLYDRDQLLAEYPEYRDEIMNPSSSAPMGSTLSGYAMGSLVRHKRTVVESIRLPIGKRPPERKDGEVAPRRKKGDPVYKPGRRTSTTANCTLVDEEYHENHYPLAMIEWSNRLGSFYPISGAERIAGIQNELNRRNWQINRTLDQVAMPTKYVRPPDGNLTVKTTKIGNVAVVRSDMPTAPVLPAVHPETYKSRVDLKEASYVEFGNPQLGVEQRIPAGLETGAAVREFHTVSTTRYSPQEAGFEQLVLDVYYLLIEACKKLGDDAPTVLESRWSRPIAWKDVDLGQVKIQISAASTLPRTAAGREQTLVEWAQAGIISTDSVKRLSNHPDLDRELSMYTAALEVIEMQIERILDGESAVPEPFDNLTMLVWRATATLNNTRQCPSAPEEVIDALGDYIAQAAWLLDQQDQQQQPAGGPVPGALPGSAPVPGMGQPTSALAPQAMQLQPGV